MEISFEKDIEAWTRGLNERERRQVPFAASLALTETAKAVREDNRAHMEMVFDRPTRFTLGSLQVTPSRKETLHARLMFKELPRRSVHYLTPQIEGGVRRHKAFEKWLIGRGIMNENDFAVPAAGARLNAAGNISPGMITQILSQLAVSPDAMQWETAKSRKRAGARRARYFVPKPGSALPRGVWRRQGKKIAPVLLFVRSPTYSVRYRFFEVSEEAALRLFPQIFDRALERAIIGR